MLKNYIKIAFKVMLRRPFFTAVSLFGISFTIMVFTCVAALLDLVIGPNPPSLNRDRTLYVNRFELSKDGQNKTRTGASYYFLDKYVRPLQSPEAVSIYTFGGGVFLYAVKKNSFRAFQMQYTDSNFWKIQQFKFVEGKPYSAQDVESGAHVAVISELMRDHYFDGQQQVVGKYIEGGELKYRVIGVVENVPMGFDVQFANIWVPITTIRGGLQQNILATSSSMQDNYHALLLAHNRSDFDKINAEFTNTLRKVDFPDPNRFNTIHAKALTIQDMLSQAGGKDLFNIIITLLLMFMLLPAINLMNINTNRIIERGSEIGVRKAFGAASSTLVVQFLTENIILTILGGIIGFGLSSLASDIFVDILNYFQPFFTFPHGQFNVNWRIILYTLLACIFFGLLSGIYPAWKMSRMHAVEALKGGES